MLSRTYSTADRNLFFFRWARGFLISPSLAKVRKPECPNVANLIAPRVCRGQEHNTDIRLGFGEQPGEIMLQNCLHLEVMAGIHGNMAKGARYNRAFNSGRILA